MESVFNLTTEPVLKATASDIMFSSFKILDDIDGCAKFLYFTTEFFDRIHIYSNTINRRVDGEQVEIVFDIQQIENIDQFLKYEKKIFI